MIFSEMLLVAMNTIILATILIISFYKWSFTYWKKRNIPFPKPSIPLGNTLNFLSTEICMFEHLKMMYDEMKQLGHKHYGIYVAVKPVYVAIDPDYVKNILTKDFTHFSDRGLYYNEKDDPLSAHLLTLEEEKWKKLRIKFTPTFTSGKMKMMFGALVNCGENMLGAMSELSFKPIEIKEICGCFTTDVIGSCVFGLDCNSFANKEADFRKFGRNIFKTGVFDALRLIICSSHKDLARKLRMKIVKPEISSFFFNVINDTIKYRQENGISRKDFLQLLMELRESDKDGLSINEIAAQSFLFFVAGFETSSVTMSLCMYQLCRNVDIQEKVRKEIERVLDKYEGKLSYEALMEMNYLNQIIDETLRMHPPIAMLPRTCTKDYKFPDDDGFIEKGTQVFIPTLALHMDPEYYPNPEKFDPDRFSEENKSTRHPYVYLPFGEGPRVCLGIKFGILQVKIGLVSLLRNYEFTLNSNTRTPLRYETTSFLINVKDPVWLNAKRIKY